MGAGRDCLLTPDADSYNRMYRCVVGDDTREIEHD